MNILAATMNAATIAVCVYGIYTLHKHNQLIRKANKMLDEMRNTYDAGETEDYED